MTTLQIINFNKVISFIIKEVEEAVKLEKVVIEHLSTKQIVFLINDVKFFYYIEEQILVLEDSVIYLSNSDHTRLTKHFTAHTTLVSEGKSLKQNLAKLGFGFESDGIKILE